MARPALKSTEPRGKRGIAAAAVKGGVAAVDRALALLATFAPGDAAMTLAEMARRTGLYKSTILRLAASLERAGYLARHADGRFRLGPAPARLGALYQTSFRLADVVEPALQRLAAATGESATFYVRDGDVRVCLHRVESAQPIRDHVRLGDHLPLERGAAGRVLLAFAAGQASAPGRDVVLVSFGERNAETTGIAAPIFGLDGSLVGAMAVAGPRSRLTRAAAQRLVPLVRDAAAALTRQLGGEDSLSVQGGSDEAAA